MPPAIATSTKSTPDEDYALLLMIQEKNIVCLALICTTKFKCAHHIDIIILNDCINIVAIKSCCTGFYIYCCASGSQYHCFHRYISHSNNNQITISTLLLSRAAALFFVDTSKMLRVVMFFVTVIVFLLIAVSTNDAAAVITCIVCIFCSSSAPTYTSPWKTSIHEKSVLHTIICFSMKIYV